MKDKFVQAALLVAVVALLLGGTGGYKYAKLNVSDDSRSARVQTSTYQGVLLVTGQFYFGKLSGEGTKNPVLRDVYYLQAQQDNQKTGYKTDVSGSQIKLIKLGSEIQGPKDELRLNPDQILYVQDLKDDGQVVKAIQAQATQAK